jgi:dolichol-phosphate mannosyltransferase
MRFPVQVIIAALNEESGIKSTITEFPKSLRSRFLVIDGHSVDRTAEVAEKCGAQVILQDGIGKGNAIMKGLQHLDPNVKYVAFTDADFTYPATHIPLMIKILEDNSEVGMVCGNRFSHEGNQEAFHGAFSFGNKLLAFAHALLNGVSLFDPLTGLRIVRADILRK